MTRLAFLGDPLRFRSWVLSAPADGIEPRFVPARSANARVELEDFAPHVVVVLDVDDVPVTLYADLDVPVVGVAAPDEDRRREYRPLPVAVPPPVSRRSLRARAGLLVLRALRRIAPRPARRRVEAARDLRMNTQLPAAAAPWDRLVALDLGAAHGRELWRLVAPPVDDALFEPPRHPLGRTTVAIAAPSTPYRERLLLGAKHFHDIRHVAHGPADDADLDVAVVLRPHGEAGFQHDVARHAAAGRLVICDHSAHGLEPGLDVLVTEDTDALTATVGAVRAAPDVHHRVRIRGRLKAERFRASRVWPALVADLRADLDAFGR